MKKVKTLLLMLTLYIISGGITQVQAKEKINFYLFYGDGCPHCEHELEFLENIEEEYKDKFNLVKYETWYNEENQQLMQAVAAKLDVEGGGVPFTVIGDKTFVGYSEENDDAIREAIVDAYDKQIDIMDGIELTGSPEDGVNQDEKNETNNLLVYFSLFIIVVGVAGLIIYAKKSVN